MTPDHRRAHRCPHRRSRVGPRGRCRDRGLRGGRCGRRGGGCARGRRRPRPRAHRIMGRRGVDGGWIHLPRWRHADPEGLRLRRFRREHGGVPECGHGSGRRREPHRRLLRGQPRAFRLARRVRGAVQGGVLRAARLGADGRRGTDVQRRGELLPVQHHRHAGAARPCPADVEQEAGRGQRRFHADEAARRDGDRSRGAGPVRRSGPTA